MPKHNSEKTQGSDQLENSRGQELVSSPGFGLGLGIGLLVGAVASSLLMTKAGTDLVAYIENKTSDWKEKATELLETSELKEMAVDLLKGKAAETLLSVKDRAAESIGSAIGAAAEKLTTAAQSTAEMVGVTGEGQTAEAEPPEMAGAGPKGKPGNGKGKSGGRPN